MPTQVKYDSNVEILYVTLTGPFNPADVRSAFEVVFDSPNIPNNADALWDLRSMDFSTADIDSVRTFAADRMAINNKRTDAKSAVVVSALQDESIVRLYFAHTQHIVRQTQIFRDPESATEWLLDQDQEDQPA